MPKFFTIAGLAALTAFAYAQYTAWSFFDSTASQSTARSTGSMGRSYHK